MKKRKLIFYVAVIAFLWSGSASVFATDYYVKTGGTGTGTGGWGNAMGSLDFSLALTNASPGDVFYVAAGIYYPSMDQTGNTAVSNGLKTFVLKPGVSVIGSYLSGLTGAANAEGDRNWDSNSAVLTTPITVFDGQNNKEHVWTVLQGDGVTETTSILDGIRVTGGYKVAPVNAGGSGIYAILNVTDRLEILNCQIDNNYTATNAGVGLDYKATTYAAGMYIAGIDHNNLGNSSLKIHNTIIDHNTTRDQSDISTTNGPWGIDIFGAGAFVTKIAAAEVTYVDIVGNQAIGQGLTEAQDYAYKLLITIWPPSMSLALKSYVLGSGMVFYNSGEADFSNLRVYENRSEGSVAGSAGLGIGANHNYPVAVTSGGSSPGTPMNYSIKNSTFNDNEVAGRFAGMGGGFGVATDGYGGGVTGKNNTAIVEIDNVTSSGNIIDVTAVKTIPILNITPQEFSAGGGFYTGGAQVTISNSTFSQNKANHGVVNSKKSDEFTQHLPREQQTGLFYAPDNSDVTLDNVLITDNIRRYRYLGVVDEHGTEGGIQVDEPMDESLNLTSTNFGILRNKEIKAEIKYSIIGSKYFENPGALTSNTTSVIQAYVDAATTIPRYINATNGQIFALAQNDAHTMTHALANPCTPALYWGNPAYAGETSQNGVIRPSVVAIGAWDAASKVDEPEPPIAVDDRAATALNTPVTVDVLANDTYDCDSEVAKKTNPANGTATVVGNQIQYTPNTGFRGKDEFIYTLTTPFGTVEAKVYIIIGGAQVDITVFLQGPTTNGTMSNNIQTAPANYFPKLRLPKTAPYSGLSVGAYCENIDNISEVGAITDWVKVEVRDVADSKIILETRALLLRTDGHIVDTDGNIPTFVYQPNAVYLTVSHRNHLAVASNSITTGLDGLVTYDFSDNLSKAYNPYVATPMVQVTGSTNVWCMWAGDLNNDEFLDSRDMLLQQGSIGVFDEYIKPDITLDGFVDTRDESIMLTNTPKGLISPILILDL